MRGMRPHHGSQSWKGLSPRIGWRSYRWRIDMQDQVTPTIKRSIA